MVGTSGNSRLRAGAATASARSLPLARCGAATPKAVVARLNAEFAKALADPVVIARIEKIGGEPLPAGKPEEVDTLLAGEFERWTKLVQATGMKIE